jgi:hypothetical protein
MGRPDKAVRSDDLKSGICKGKRAEKHRDVLLSSFFRLSLIFRED